MAYGKNKDKKDWVRKAIPLAIGKTTTSKETELAKLYDAVVSLMQAMSTECFFQEPLHPDFDTFSLEKSLVAIQKSQSQLNQVWAEQARLRVTPALEESYKRYFKRLTGCLRFVDSKIDYPKVPAGFVGPLPLRRAYYQVPVETQDMVTEDDLAGLKTIAENKETLERFRRLILNDDASGLTPSQVVILRDIHARAQLKHNQPRFAADSSFTLQLHLDYRMLPSTKATKKKPERPAEALMLRSGEAYLLKDNDNKVYRRFLDISGVEPNTKRIRIPVILNRTLSQRLETTRNDYAALIVELTRDDTTHLNVGARLVCGKPEPEALPLAKAIFFAVGRDYGYKNTICLSLIESETPIDLEGHIPALAIKSKEEAEEALQKLVLPGHVKTLKQIQFSGQNFLKGINQHCQKIEKYTSGIDKAYNELMVLKGQIVTILNLADDELISQEHKKSAAEAQVKRFFQLYGNIQFLKKARRDRYKKISAMKKSWFGFLSNQEIKLAKEYNAVIVREDLTVEALEKDAPDYKGRRFNRMINNGSKGQYQNKASEKMIWNGVLEIIIGSWYTSRFCGKHGLIIDKKYRQGERLYLPCCQRHDHADLHASETIASAIFLRPKPVTLALKSERL